MASVVEPFGGLNGPVHPLDLGAHLLVELLRVTARRRHASPTVFQWTGSLIRVCTAVYPTFGNDDCALCLFTDRTLRWR